MIIEVRAKNCYVFEDDITFSMKADMRNKKFGANVDVYKRQLSRIAGFRNEDKNG